MEESAPSRGTVVCLAGMLAGLLMLLAGLAWSAFASPEVVWTPEQAAEHQAAGEALHAARRSAPPAASRPPSGDQSAVESPELAAAQSRFDVIESQLIAAQSRLQGTGVWLTRVGLAVMVICGVGYLGFRSE